MMADVPVWEGRNELHVLRELFVVYDADGTVAGELVYLFRKWFGRGHCGACDITHGPKREKPEWTSWKETLGLPVKNIHRDEMDIDLYNATKGLSFPCVVGRDISDEHVYVMGPEDLNWCEGDIDKFEMKLKQKLSDVGATIQTIQSDNIVCPLKIMSQDDSLVPQLMSTE
mmetsp:Transcript_37136/g.37809  ORF Transcript_37136/g.37809 Transcript_37136/m.37809 type:complete len:171 (-) Transcript_37136:36-548(-)